MNFIVSATCAGSRWQQDQWCSLHVITTAYHVLHTTPPKLLRAFISLAKYPPMGGYFASHNNRNSTTMHWSWCVRRHRQRRRRW